MSAFSSCTIEVEFTAGVWTDLTGRLRMPVTIKRGRPTPFDDVAPGTLKVVFDNHDGALMPESLASPYYPNVTKMKRIRFKVTKSAVTYTRFFGWIMAIEPKFPGSSLADARVEITAVDGLGLLAMKSLHSWWTEQALYRGRVDGTVIDAYEAIGDVAGQYAFLTNWSEDASPGTSTALNFSGAPPLSFSTDNIMATGPIVITAPDSSDHSCTTKAGLQASPLNIQLFFRSPRDHTPSTSTLYVLMNLEDGGASRLVNLVIADNAGSNGLYLYDSGVTTNLGFFLNLSNSQWYSVAFTQNAGTATHTDVQVWDTFGNTASVNNVNFDIRNVRLVEMPAFGSVLDAAYTGVVATGSRTRLAWSDGLRAGNTSAPSRMTALANACSRLPLSFTQVGTWTAQLCIGDWWGRKALDVGREICRSTRNPTGGSPGLLFARPRDSQILAIDGSNTYPTTILCEVDWELDALVGTEVSTSVDQAPTRVTVTTPQTTKRSVDTTAEAAGEFRELPVAVLNQGIFSDASDIAGWFLGRNKAMRISKLKMDLFGAVNDDTAALFDESGTNTGLFPSALIRVVGLPPTHFNYLTKDMYVEGWTEVYQDDSGWIEADTSSVNRSILCAESFTGTNGSALSGTNFDLRQDNGGGTGSSSIQGNRGRITTAATAGAYSVQRLTTQPGDGELPVTFQLRDSSVIARVFVRSNSNFLTSGYYLEMAAGSTQNLQWRSGGSTALASSWTQTLAALTDYSLRFRWANGWLYWRVWATAGSEPSGWNLWVDPSPLPVAGGTRIGLSAGTPDAVARSVDWDDLNVYSIT